MSYEVRRHPATMSSVRLKEDMGRWPERFTEAEREAIATLRRAYQRIAAEDEAATGRQGMDAWNIVYARGRQA